MPDTKLTNGKQIKTTGGQLLTITRWLGEGGQGDVYEVDVGGKPMALKWYKSSALKEPGKFRSNLEKNINDGAPSDVFLWPEALTEELNGTFGYIMKLRPSEYADFSRFLKAKVRFKDGQTAIRASLMIVNAFKLLHNRGCSYQDINDGNFFINPDTGDVLVCDNDNVAEYGASFGIAGKPGYVAPEIVLGEKKPSVHTDRFSLAVMLFLALVMARPFEGQMTRVPCLTESHERKFFGEDPAFIFHPTDTRNRPVRGLDNNAISLWPSLPKYIQDAFAQTFVDGLKDVGGNEDHRRTTETEWEKLLLRLRDETIICPACGWETIYPTDDTEAVCLNEKCSHALSQLLQLKFQRNKVVIYPSMKIYGNHMGKTDDFDSVLGEVVVNKKNPNLWGIKNLSSLTWQEHTPDGKVRTVENGNAVRALSGITVSFGNSITAEITL